MKTLKSLFTASLLLLSISASAYIDSNADIADMRTTMRDQQAVARFRVAKYIEQIYRATKAEMSKDGMTARSSECERFVNEIRYKAATIYVRIHNVKQSNLGVDIVTDPRLSENDLAVVQSWIGFARNSSREVFAGAFSPKSCTGRQDSKMTEAVADSTIRVLDSALRNLEIQ